MCYIVHMGVQCASQHTWVYNVLVGIHGVHNAFNSTEIALLKVHNDITLNIDQSKVTALTLLDLSAVFDTIDHNTLIKC